MAIAQIMDVVVGGLNPRIAIFGEGTLITEAKTITDVNGIETQTVGIYGISSPLPDGEIPKYLNEELDSYEYAPIMIGFRTSDDVRSLIDTLTDIYGMMTHNEAVAMVLDDLANEDNEEQYDECEDACCDCFGQDDEFYDDEEVDKDEFSVYCTGEQDTLNTALVMTNKRAAYLICEAMERHSGVDFDAEMMSNFDEVELEIFMAMFGIERVIDIENGYVTTKMFDTPILQTYLTIEGNTVSLSYKFL